MLHEKSLKSCDTLSGNFTMDKMRGLSNQNLRQIVKVLNHKMTSILGLKDENFV